MSNINKLLGYIHYFLGFMYIALGAFLIAASRSDSEANEILHSKYAVIFGAVMICYGLFRIYRAYKAQIVSNRQGNTNR